MKKSAVFIVLFVILSTSVLADLPFRPVCAPTETISNKPWQITDYWLDGLVFTDPTFPDAIITNGDYELCYINESLMFIQYDYGTYEYADSSTLLRRETEDMFYVIDESNANFYNKFKLSTGFKVHFDYYFPSEGGICYPQAWELFKDWNINQYVFFNNVDYYPGNPCYTDPTNKICEYEDGQYLFTYEEKACDVWHSFNGTISGDERSTFDGDYYIKDKMVSFGFNMANIYITHVEFIIPDKDPTKTPKEYLRLY